ncbi:MAG: sulfatase, partial [Myxococcota bacterium]
MPTQSGQSPRYVVVWVMDALRADRVQPFHGNARPDVPNLQRLALTGAVFRNHWVQGSEPRASYASLWTSLYPANHGVRVAGERRVVALDRRFTTMAETVKDAGLFTVGVIGNRLIDMGNGYAEGFETWRNLARRGAAQSGVISASMIIDIGGKFLANKWKSGPGLLFVGTTDTGKPWLAREPWTESYDRDPKRPEPYRGPYVQAVTPAQLGMAPGAMSCNAVPTERDRARINAIYDSNISYQDQQLGRLMARLADLGIAEQTMIIVAGAHGEELWEHGICGHGASLRETVVRTPLLIHFPPLIPSGRIIADGVESVDVLPTILAALGRPPLDAAQGASLLPLAQGLGTGYPRATYASQFEVTHAMRIGLWKARVGKSGIPQVYDLQRDPDEKRDLAGESPLARRFLTDALSLFLIHRSQWKKRDWGVASNMSGRAAA